jgi:hypothetical protein
LPAFGLLIIHPAGANGVWDCGSVILSGIKPAGLGLLDPKSPTFRRGMRVWTMNFAETPGAPTELSSDGCLVLSRDGGPGLDSVMKIEQFLIN